MKKFAFILLTTLYAYGCSPGGQDSPPADRYAHIPVRALPWEKSAIDIFPSNGEIRIGDHLISRERLETIFSSFCSPPRAGEPMCDTMKAYNLSANTAMTGETVLLFTHKDYWHPRAHGGFHCYLENDSWRCPAGSEWSEDDDAFGTFQ